MSENKNVSVRLRKGGWEVEITCPPEQLQKAVESVLSTLTTASTISAPSIAEKAQSTGNRTCRGLIMELWEESWFDQARALSEVHEEIARRGYHYDRTAVSHSLTDLVRENILFRQGNTRNYAYIQKRPAGTPRPQGEKPELAEGSTEPSEI
ncbi:MAG: hypothetical protein JRN20_08170 [Nitrososphaerota archaeon]|jgi:hypothetical protein|nr:hypothetical protein [Nitrososphaerota archaeon]MDG6922839.1 hypothetical protein [Nitrososphaerota archaeon]